MHRAPTRYRRIDERNSREYADDIELLGHRSDNKSNVGADCALEQVATIEFDAFAKNARTQPSDSPQAILNAKEHRFLSGWRVGALVSLIGVLLVFTCNLTLFLTVRLRHGTKSDGSIGTLFEGDCDRTRRLNTWVHLIVNVLSTLLLGASNYCMQILSAPTREELVRAHRRRTWLHIGVPSLRNLRHIGRNRSALWLALCLSSMPLHLLFNSVVFTNLQANEYAVVPTTEDWLHGGTYNTSGFIDMDSSLTASVIDYIDTYRINETSTQGSYTNTRGFVTAYEKVNVAECFNTYNDQYVSNAGNVYIIQDGATVWRNLSHWYLNRTVLDGSYHWNRSNYPIGSRSSYRNTPLFNSAPSFYPSNGWRCLSHVASECDIEDGYEVPKNRSQWRPFEAPIKYCLIEKVEERCKLQFSFPIALLVIVSNGIKALCMLLTLIVYRKHLPLVTLGDAIAHFLDEPDPETKGRCLYSKSLMEAQWTWELTHGAQKDELGVWPEAYDPKRRLWRKAPSSLRWATTYFLYCVAIIFGSVCAARSMDGMPKDPRKLFKVGFGTVTGNNLLSMNTSLIGGILLANLPQALLSYIYLAFNALYTNMFVGQEWSSYKDTRKSLRVTAPIGEQRDTYWLNVPFRYAVPMTVISGIFHWLASQSLFLVQVTVMDDLTRQVSTQISTCGFSPFAIIMCTVLGSILAGGGIVIGKLRYPGGMPLAGSCSAAISACCHPPPGDIHASILPVQWGAVSHGQEVESLLPASAISLQTSERLGTSTTPLTWHEVIEGTKGAGKKASVVLGHCTFTSLLVEEPRPRHLYA